MKKIFEINYEIFDENCIVCIKSTVEELEKYLKKKDLKFPKSLKNKVILRGEVPGICITLESGQAIIMLNELDIDTIVHEVFHAIYSLTKSIDVQLTNESEEVFCYLIGYLTTKILEKIKGRKIKK